MIGHPAECPAGLVYVVENMREWDRREIFATRGNDDQELFAIECLTRAGTMSWLIGETNPIAVFGGHLLWPGVYNLWFFATDEINKVGKSVTKFARNVIDTTFAEGGAHRMECRSMEGHHDAQRWLSVLGAEREGTLFDYGRGRETFHVYAWRR